MQYSALILTTQEQSTERTVVYETYNGNSFVVVKEKYLEEVWTVDSHLILPKAVLDFMEIFRMEQRNGGVSREGYSQTWSRSVVYDRFQLDNATRKILHQYDCSTVPIYPNQSQTFEELHLIDDYWNHVDSPTSEMEDSTVLNSPFNDLNKPVPETPKPEDATQQLNICYAPKKRRQSKESGIDDEHNYSMDPSCTPKKLRLSDF